jgi:hypothetical protein
MEQGRKHVYKCGDLVIDLSNPRFNSLPTNLIRLIPRTSIRRFTFTFGYVRVSLRLRIPYHLMKTVMEQIRNIHSAIIPTSALDAEPTCSLFTAFTSTLHPLVNYVGPAV